MPVLNDIAINNSINASDLWEGIGGHFDSLGQIINEFIDNAIANFEANSPLTRNVIISIREVTPSGSVNVTIEDSGTGIKNLDAAFSMGDKSAAESPLNEHGFGIKHALASANPLNNNWGIFTRLEENCNGGTFIKIAAPYTIGDFKGELTKDNWPGLLNGTGTFIQFECGREMFNTIASGIRGGVRNFITICDILCEDIGFIYAGLIKENKVSITLRIIPFGEAVMTRSVGALEPDWGNFVDSPGKGSILYDLGNGNVTIEYAFGFMNEKAERRPFDNNTSRKYYKKNMSSSGVEIRVNGRVLEYNLFKEIWGIEKHNSYNSFLVTIDLKSVSKERLPLTRTSKNGFRKGDEKLEGLYAWILSKMNEPQKDSSLSTDEREKFDDLARRRKTVLSSVDAGVVIKTEMPVFTTTGNRKDLQRIDMYESVNGRITIYEGKVDSTTSKDVYQLRMYWDGLVYDGLNPNQAVLVSGEHPSSVEKLINIVNTMKDASGNNYSFVAKRWSDL